jgi:hypothetical protein
MNSSRPVFLRGGLGNWANDETITKISSMSDVHLINAYEYLASLHCDDNTPGVQDKINELVKEKKKRNL